LSCTRSTRRHDKTALSRSPLRIMVRLRSSQGMQRLSHPNYVADLTGALDLASLLDTVIVHEKEQQLFFIFLARNCTMDYLEISFQIPDHNLQGQGESRGEIENQTRRAIDLKLCTTRIFPAPTNTLRTFSNRQFISSPTQLTLSV